MSLTVCSYCHHLIHTNTNFELRKPFQLSSSFPLFLFPNNERRLNGRPVVPLALPDVEQGSDNIWLGNYITLYKSGGHFGHCGKSSGQRNRQLTRQGLSLRKTHLFTYITVIGPITTGTTEPSL